MSTETAAAVLLIAAPVLFNVTFALLGTRLEYPDILRRPGGEILERFRAGGSSLILLWRSFMLSGLLMIGAVVLFGEAVAGTGVIAVATVVGVLAGLVQMLGLLRWVYVVPSLARAYADPSASEQRRDTTVAIFRALHQHLGVGVGAWLAGSTRVHRRSRGRPQRRAATRRDGRTADRGAGAERRPRIPPPTTRSRRR